MRSDVTRAGTAVRQIVAKTDNRVLPDPTSSCACSACPKKDVRLRVMVSSPEERLEKVEEDVERIDKDVNILKNSLNIMG